MNMYFIALVAPEEINAAVLQWKHWFRDQFGCTVALKSPAHITLIPPFWMQPELEEDLVSSIVTFSQTRKSFEIMLNNFSAFKPGVIYVDVLKNEQLENFYSCFSDYFFSINKFPLKKDNRPFHPHVTLATRDLYKKAFYKAWEIFSEREFEAQWLADSISLLRHNKKNWDVIFTSRFTK